MASFWRVHEFLRQPPISDPTRKRVQNRTRRHEPIRTKTAAKKPPVAAPDGLAAALKKNRKAQATFDGFPPSQQREYVEWLTEAKREETRARRLEQAVAWMAEGKRRHWKYQNC